MATSDKNDDGLTSIGPMLWAGKNDEGNFEIQSGRRSTGFSPGSFENIEVEREHVPNLLRMVLGFLDMPIDRSPDAIVTDLRLDVRWAQRLEENMTALAGVVSDLMTAAEKRLADKSDVVASDLATRDYVDTGLKRLSAALREHVAKVTAEAFRAAQPGPGLLQRVLAAVRPTVGYRPSAFPSTPDPQRASAMGAAAARGVCKP
jgi:hypothetical protein